MDLISDEIFESKKKTVNQVNNKSLFFKLVYIYVLLQVIKRMVKHDGVVIIVSGYLEENTLLNEKKQIKLHPSYVP